MKFLLTTIFLVLVITESFGCDCGPVRKINEIRKTEFAVTELIFIGEIISISSDKKEIQIKVKEVFKGSISKTQLLIGQNNIYCEPYVENTGEWLIYGKIENGKLKINICGLSRSLEKPYENRYFRYIQIPPPQNATENEIIKIDLINQESLEKNNLKAFSELSMEIEWLKTKIN